MYISQKGGKVAAAQMELGDYLGSSRKIIFDLEDPKDAKKAQRTLKPKGIRSHHRRKKKIKPTIQKELEKSLPKSFFTPMKKPKPIQDDIKTKIILKKTENTPITSSMTPIKSNLPSVNTQQKAPEKRITQWTQVLS